MAQKDRRVRQDQLATPDHRASKELKDHKVLQAHVELLVLKVFKGLRALKVRRDLVELLVHRALMVHRDHKVQQAQEE